MSSAFEAALGSSRKMKRLIQGETMPDIRLRGLLGLGPAGRIRSGRLEPNDEDCI